LKGSSLQTKHLSNLTRAINFLENLDYGDANRIGIIGHSVDGQEATWLTWYDKRLKRFERLTYGFLVSSSQRAR